MAPPKNSAETVVTPSDLCGLLRREFVLGDDWVHFDDTPTGHLGWGPDRLGEDVIANNLLAFDIKVFDPQSTTFTTSQGVCIGPSDPGYRESVIDALAGTGTVPTLSQQRGEIKGGFVDLAYPVLAGGSVRGWQARFLDSLNEAGSASAVITEHANTQFKYLITTFSGVSSYSSPALGPHLALLIPYIALESLFFLATE